MNSPYVLLLHSGGFTSRQWKRLSEALSPEHRVVAPNLLGYDGEPWPPGKPFHFRQDVDELVEQLDREAAPVHLVGHSYGGLLAFQVAARRPALVRSIAVFEPVVFGILDRAADADVVPELEEVSFEFQLGSDGAADEAWLEQFVDWWNGKGTWRALPAETRENMRSVGWKLYQEVASLIEDRMDRAAYQKIEVPTLLLGGERTRNAERRVLAKLAAALPRATLRLFPGVGHMGPITHASTVNPVIVEHIQRASR